MSQEASSPIRILLVDDHAIVREGYRALLQKQARLTVVAEAADGAEAYQLYRQHHPDIVVMDISLPGQSGLKALDRIRQLDADARIVVFSMHQT
ncbi:two-component response regulator, partial [Methylophaga lonarensis MPL]